jgi:hypothetical protein
MYVIQYHTTKYTMIIELGQNQLRFAQMPYLTITDIMKHILAIFFLTICQ